MLSPGTALGVADRLDAEVFAHPRAQSRDRAGGASRAACRARSDPEHSRPGLEGYYLFWATLGEMHLRLGEFGRAAPHFERAIALTSSRVERQFLHRKLEACRRAGEAV